MTTPPAEPQPAPGDTLETRVGKLETGQESIAGKVDKILGILDKPADPAAEPVTTADPAPDAPDMAEQMRQAVRDVHAEAAAAAAKDSKPKPEVQPREAGQPFRQRLGEVIHGREPKR